MSELITSKPIALPEPRVPIAIRDATPGDVPFIDALQKQHGSAVGFMRTSWIEAKIEKGEVIVAIDPIGTPLGYCMGVDRYFKRDDVGIIHQMNIVPGRQRSLLGATLLKAMFERAAYGCRLYCCWCAQDLAANAFWEAMGFVPLAYRAGSEKKGRVHLFWQKRIRAGDDQTPWWFPAKTDAGAMNADRLVLPIPPGLHWSDPMPVILLPAEEPSEAKRQLPAKTSRKPLDLSPPTKQGPRQYGGPPAKPVPVPVVTTAMEKPQREKKPNAKEATPRARADPKLIAAARELRDRWLEQVNANPALLTGEPRYEINRLVTAGLSSPTPLLTSPIAA